MEIWTNSPFKIGYLLCKHQTVYRSKMGTKPGLNPSRFGMIEIQTFGDFSFRVSDAGDL